MFAQHNYSNAVILLLSADSMISFSLIILKKNMIWETCIGHKMRVPLLSTTVFVLTNI